MIQYYDYYFIKILKFNKNILIIFLIIKTFFFYMNFNSIFNALLIPNN